MIRNMYLDGFRHFKDFTVNFHHPYTLICGLNGTGKTAVLEVLSRLQAFILNECQVSDLCQWTDIPAWKVGSPTVCETTLRLEMETEGIVYAYSLLLLANQKDGAISIGAENLHVDNRIIFESKLGTVVTLKADNGPDMSYPADLSLTGLSLAERNSGKVGDFLQAVKTSLFSLSINPYFNHRPIPAISANEPVLRIDTSNFPAWYNFVLEREALAIVKAFDELRNFIPGFRQFSFRQNGVSKEVMADIATDKKYQIPFDSLSHGQKILSILHLVVRVAPAHSTIAIDELENFLAPTELQPLFDAFQDAYEEKNIQFILISHHPKTLNWFNDSAIVFSVSGNPPRLEAHDFDENIGLVDFLQESAMAHEL